MIMTRGETALESLKSGKPTATAEFDFLDTLERILEWPLDTWSVHRRIQVLRLWNVPRWIDVPSI